MSQPMRASDFEQRYRENVDPWHYRSSAYEAAKYEATLRACGAGPFRCALELGGSIGVFSKLLAPRCRELTTIDFSPTAVLAARVALAGHPGSRALVGRIPNAIPTGDYDLVVASEVLYYLEPRALEMTLARLGQVLAVDARLVAVHWRPPGPDRPQSATDVHRQLCAAPWLEASFDGSTDDYLLHVLERR
jgi:SAM-dependent methyltransferase